ncbi:GNAT family N-acetyltransferase [Patescibacteria group bacterium]|nr:GNAT family N-acetyltransferase [Patescibacteria group bacterium]MBU1683200.1 GNAT family N-acetyltransferase [Patescibacteria group bacterium]
MKFPRLKLKKAKIGDTKPVTKLFTAVDKNVCRNKVLKWISEGKVYVLKDHKKIRGAVSYTVFGILGLFSLMYIHKISVAPDLQGKGLGSFLLSRMKLRSIKIGVTAFILYSFKNVISFYKKNKLNNIWRFFWWRNKENA